MEIKDITVDWLQKQKFVLQSIYKPTTIQGVICKTLSPIVDGRGDIVELWSNGWTDSADFIPPQHCYQSGTDAGVIKCWHLHDIHTDQMTITRGKIQIVLVDVRQDSPTFGHVNSVFMGAEKPAILKIPSGVMHGWKALSSPEVLIVNFQSHTYDPKDEFKFPWDCVLSDIWEPKNA